MMTSVPLTALPVGLVQQTHPSFLENRSTLEVMRTEGFKLYR